jgi:hypothetical protein
MGSEYVEKSQAEIDKYVILTMLGYLGKKRDQKIKEFDENLGEGSWMIGWVTGENLVWNAQVNTLEGEYVVLDYARACKLYEDAYYAHFKQHAEELEWLVKNASEVFDNAQSNINSSLDYLKQEESTTHIQDITIRNIVARFGRRFEGSELVQIRTDGLGEKWNPANLYFHRQDWFVEPRNAGNVWWCRERYKAKEKSVECFWQSNKFLLVKGKNG